MLRDQRNREVNQSRPGQNLPVARPAPVSLYRLFG
jgi:hypothetical protein